MWVLGRYTTLGDDMGYIFKDLADDQQEAMLETMYVGQTWQFRYLRAKWITIAIIGSVASAVSTALIDYSISEFTDYTGIIGFILG